MDQGLRILAGKGSPHAGMGNTSQMIERLRPALGRESFDPEVIHLANLDLRYGMGRGY